MSGNIVPLILLAIYLATALVAGEFEWGTVRTMHPDVEPRGHVRGPDRARGRLRPRCVAVGLILGAILPFLLSADGKPLQSYAVGPSDPDLVSGVASSASPPSCHSHRFRRSWPCLARGIGLAFLLTLLLFAADVAITVCRSWPDSPLSWIPRSPPRARSRGSWAATASPLAAVAPASLSSSALLA